MSFNVHENEHYIFGLEKIIQVCFECNLPASMISTSPTIKVHLKIIDQIWLKYLFISVYLDL